MVRWDTRRLGEVQAALQGKLTRREGAESLGRNVRQFKRLRTRVRPAGGAGIVHGNRGRPSPRRPARLPPRTQQDGRVVAAMSREE